MPCSERIAKYHDIQNLTYRLTNVVIIMTFMTLYDICDVCDINDSVKQKVPTLLKEVIDSVPSNSGPPTAVAKIWVKYAASMLYVRVCLFYFFPLNGVCKLSVLSGWFNFDELRRVI